MITPTFINFTPIGTTYCNKVKNNNLLQFSGLNFKGRELENDTFEFSKKSDYNEKDFNEIKKSIKKENYLGAGAEGRVFQMENQEYVVKIPQKFFNDKKVDNLSLKKDLIEEKVTNKDKVNHIVKKYQNGITIMNRVLGKQIKTEEEFNEVANLPVKAYNKLLNQILDAEAQGMKFDYAMNNILYDKETGSLNAIDFRPFKKGEKKFNPLEKMYFAFDCFKKPHEKKVAGKIMYAALKNMEGDIDDEKAKLDYDFSEITRLVGYNNPRLFGIMENIKHWTNILKCDRKMAETNYELSLFFEDIHRVKNSINTFLINESEQA